MLYSYKKQYPSPLPFRIILSDGRTRTDPTTFTEEEIADAGFVFVAPAPIAEEYQSVYWNGDDWVVHTKTEEEIAAETQSKLNGQWMVVRAERDQRMKDFEWRYIRHDREVRLGLTVSDDLVAMDEYMQALADITLQTDPFNITWPIF